ncbi:hypothetical protein RB195_016421 [Necator americanus]|uniref:Uncharacterized protein n=1 Tax=Necator americanus TaxID=51031 RepID=A0ABR1C3L1_NECAM
MGTGQWRDESSSQRQQHIQRWHQYHQNCPSLVGLLRKRRHALRGPLLLLLGFEGDPAALPKTPLSVTAVIYAAKVEKVAKTARKKRLRLASVHLLHDNVRPI